MSTSSRINARSRRRESPPTVVVRASVRARRPWLLVGLCLTLAMMLTHVPAADAWQSPGRMHYPQTANLPPGAIGQHQLLRGGPLPGYFQPVEIRAPRGALVSLAADGGFLPPTTGPITAGMQIGYVYRLRIGNIAGREGFDVYPTIEVINRLYPPPGQETRFAIPIDLPQEDLELAIAGQFVTRVVYLEDPQGALPVAEDPQRQRSFEARPGDDPLELADRLGRPMAIVRFGSRVPTEAELSGRFTFGTPPLAIFPTTASQLPAGPRYESPGHHVPRRPLPIEPELLPAPPAMGQPY